MAEIVNPATGTRASVADEHLDSARAAGWQVVKPARKSTAKSKTADSDEK